MAKQIDLGPRWEPGPPPERSAACLQRAALRVVPEQQSILAHGRGVYRPGGGFWYAHETAMVRNVLTLVHTRKLQWFAIS